MHSYKVTELDYLSVLIEGFPESNVFKNIKHTTSIPSDYRYSLAYGTGVNKGVIVGLEYFQGSKRIIFIIKNDDEYRASDIENIFSSFDFYKNPTTGKIWSCVLFAINFRINSCR